MSARIHDGDNLMKFKVSIRMRKKSTVMVLDGPVLVFQKLLIYWNFPHTTIYKPGHQKT